MVFHMVLLQGLLKSPSTLALYIILLLTLVLAYTCMLLTARFILSLTLPLNLPLLPIENWKPVLLILANGCENKLQLNEDKTELAMITPSQQAGKVYIKLVCCK